MQESPEDAIVVNGSHRINKEADDSLSREILTFNAL